MYSNEDEKSDTLYSISQDLTRKGYISTASGLLCPLADKYYLKIERKEKNYSFAIVENTNNTFYYKSPVYTCKEAITEYKDIRNKKLNEYWKNINKTTDIYSQLSTIAIDLMNEDDYSQINKAFNVYEEEQHQKTDDYSIDEAIELRKHPKLNSLEKRRAKQVEKKLKEVGLIKYLENLLDNLHIGNHKNIYLFLLGAFKIMLGESSYIFESIARSGEGKSLEQSIVFEHIIPEEYIYKVNSMTVSSFTRYSEKNEYYFDRLIILFGDLGSRKSFANIESLLNIFKVMITENEYLRDLTDTNENGNYSNKQLVLKCESIGAVYSSVINDFTQADSQLESRTISCTPYKAKESEVMDFMIMLEYNNSPQSKKKRTAEKELKRFQKYLLNCVNMDLTIINPYGEIFKDHSKHSDIPKRQLKQIMELFDAYCKLTYFECDNINGHLVSSKKQITDFMKEVSMENALIPYESDFLKMLMGKGTNNELTIINTNDENDLNPLDEYYNKVLDALTDVEVDSFSDLKYYQEEQAVKKLLQLYRLGGTAEKHETNVFFRIKDIRRVYSRYKAYKNIDDVKTLIHRLVKKQFIEPIEYQYSKENIYYLTEKCENITQPFELTEEYKDMAEKFLKEVGVVDRLS